MLPGAARIPHAREYLAHIFQIVKLWKISISSPLTRLFCTPMSTREALGCYQTMPWTTPSDICGWNDTLGSYLRGLDQRAYWVQRSLVPRNCQVPVRFHCSDCMNLYSLHVEILCSCSIRFSRLRKKVNRYAFCARGSCITTSPKLMSIHTLSLQPPHK